MRAMLRGRFWFESALAAAAAVALALTALWPDWIERLTGAEPDGGDGSLEWLLSGSLVLLLVVSAAMARAEWRRAAPSG